MIEIFDFIAEEAGTHLLIFGAIHGNEVCGARALQGLVDELRTGRRKLPRGRLTLVPVCNPRAFAENCRFIEENLNRVFEPAERPSSYERRMAQRLWPLVERCDVFLDLHSMQSDGEPFAVMNSRNPASEALCRALGTAQILSGWPELYRAHPDKNSACTQTFADRLGKPNALIECGRHGTIEADAVAREAVERALAHCGLGGNASPVTRSQRLIRLQEVHFRESPGDQLVRDFANFDPVRSGELLARRGDGREIRAPRDGLVIFPSPVSAIGTEFLYFGAPE